MLMAMEAYSTIHTTENAHGDGHTIAYRAESNGVMVEQTLIVVSISKSPFRKTAVFFGEQRPACVRSYAQ